MAVILKPTWINWDYKSVIHRISAAQRQPLDLSNETVAFNGYKFINMTKITKIMLNEYMLSINNGEQTAGKLSPFFQLYGEYLRQHYSPLSTPGKVLFVIGTGRNGSTSMANALRCLPNSLITHERPPLLHWRDPQQRLAFHIRFIEISRRYFAFVGDVSHWWLPHLSELSESLGEIKVIHLQRQPELTVASFIRLKSRQGKSYNHWVEPQASWWTRDSWDSCYPKYPLPDKIDPTDKAAVSHYVISRYVEDYHHLSDLYVAQNNALTVQLTELFSTQGKQKVSDYLDLSNHFRQQLMANWDEIHLNKHNTEHSANMPVFA